MNYLAFAAGKEGYYGRFGGAFIPEILKPAIDELTLAFQKAKRDPDFWPAYEKVLKEYGGRPTPLTPLTNLSQKIGGAQIVVKREDLNHTGAHKFNNVMGQGMLAKRLGKKRVIAETGAGQHGVATATMAARLGFACSIYMGEEDVERQYPNVFWMQQLGAEVIAVKEGAKTLKDAINAALRDWSSSFPETHYVLGTACGPHPFPEMVAWFQQVIGQEARKQVLGLTGKLPDKIYACVGGGSNAIGIFAPFLNDKVELIAVEAAGKGIETGHHALRIFGNQGKVGVAHGYKTYFLQDSDGQMNDTYSIAPGLDYVGISPIFSYLKEVDRVQFVGSTDEQVIKTLKLVMQNEGLIPALESAHAFAAALNDAPQMKKDQIIMINQSGRGDKDIFSIADALADPSWKTFLRSKV